MAAPAFYPAGFSPPPVMFPTGPGARRSVWSPPGMGGALGVQQPPPYGYPYPAFSYSNGPSCYAGHLPPPPPTTSAAAAPAHGYYAPQPPTNPRYSLPGITGQGQGAMQHPYAPRKPELELAYGPASSSHYPAASAPAAPVSTGAPGTVLYPQLPLARAFSQPGKASAWQPAYDPPSHPPPGFQPPPPYRAYDHAHGARYFVPAEEWLAPSQQQQAPPPPQQPQQQLQAQPGFGAGLPPRFQHHQQQQQHTAWSAAAPEAWNPWADAEQQQAGARAGAASGASAPTKGVGAANYGAVGEKRTKRADVVDVKDPAAFAAAPVAGKAVKDAGGMEWEQLMTTVVYPDYDQAHHATPPPPPPAAEERLPVEYQLVPPSNPVLPPPPIEKSAVPLSAVGAGMIWELCALPFSGSAVKVGSFDLDKASPRASEWMGRVLSVPIEEPLSLGQPAMSLGGEAVEDSWSPWGPDKPSASKAAADAARPTTEFKTFVESILTQTLLTPQVLLLAILFVAKVAGGAALPLAAGSPLANQERAPYSMFLAGVMIANKILDDNSYRTETFAQVSGVSLSELNRLEVFFLGALDWSLSVDRDVWCSWMAQVCAWNGYWHPSAPGKADAAATAMLASLLDQAASDDMRSPCEPAMGSFDATYESQDVDFFQDATGPVKSPFQTQRVSAWHGTSGEA